MCKKKMLPLLAVAVSLITLAPRTGYASVVTFGGICGTSCTDPVSAGYGGFSWDGNILLYGNDNYTSGYSNSYGAPSGAAAYNAFGTLDVTITSPTPITFNGADFTGWAESNAQAGFSATTITISMYDSLDNLLNSTGRVALSFNSYNFVSAGDTPNVSKIVLESTGGANWWLMDNFTYNAGASTPEPGSLLLLGGGFLGLGLIRRHRRA
jgi:hypothetical protein